MFVGGPGTGKTTLCLRFIAEGLARGEPAAMLVMGRGSDVKAHALHLGLDLNAALRHERLILLRYRSDFAQRIGHAPTAQSVIDDFEWLIAPIHPSRIVVDSIAPLLGEPGASGSALAALAALLERIGATSALTYPEDVTAGYDRRLEPLMQDAAAILRFDRAASDREVAVMTLTSRGAPLERAVAAPGVRS